MSSNKSYDTLVDFNDYKTGVLYDTDGILVTLKNSPAFKEMYYNASYEVEYERILDADIELYEDSVEGIVTNCSDETIMNAFIIADTLYVPVGDIESGEAIEINGDEALGLISTGLSGYVDEWSMEVLEELSASEVRQRSSTRSVLMQTVGNGKYYIVGYQDAPTSENPLKEVCTSDQSFGTSVLIVDVDTGQDDETEWFVSNIDQHLVSEYNTGYFAELRYMTSNVLDAVYQFPKESHVTSLIYSEMLNNIPSDSYYEIAQETYAFNHETEEFDLIFLSARDSETQVVAEESLTAYIDDDNTILVRYRYSGIESICMIPILSCYQEQCDDINAD